MLLAIDIGNTETCWGLFSGSEIKARWSTATLINRTADDLQVAFSGLMAEGGFKSEVVTDVSMCSVVPPLTGIFENMFAAKLDTKPLVIGAGVKTGIKIRMDNPREVGPDRIVNAIAAHQLYGGPVIVVDLGTATNFDVVSPKGEYLGGAIAPGLKSSIESLYQRTALLPRIDLVRPEKAIGTNTIAAMRSGLIFGYVGLIEGLLRRLKQELDPGSRVVATGGLAWAVARETEAIDIINPDLTLIGLRIAFELNSGESR